MHFANPGFLWAFFLLIIPIIIHLFKFRRYKEVLFPNIQFLQKINEDQKAKRRLKDLLILLARLLAISCLVLAFSLPFIGSVKNASKGNVLSVYIDNSFSMENESEKGKLLDIAKQKAEELVMTFQPSDQFQLITNDLETRHQRLVNRQAFLQFLYEVDLSASSVALSDIYQRQITLLEDEVQYDKWIALLSDLQRSTTDLENLNVQEEIKMLFLPIKPNNFNNIYIDSIWFEEPVRQIGKSETMHFSIRNESSEDLDEIGIRLSINGQLKSMAAMAVPANRNKDTLLHFTNANVSGIQNGVLSVDDEPISFDNDYFFSYNLKEKIKISEIKADDAQNNFKLIYSDSLYDFTSFSINQIDYQELTDADLIVLNNLNTIPSGLSSFLTKWVSDGGHIYISPGQNLNQIEYNQFLNNLGATILSNPDTNDRRVARVEIEDDLFKGVLKATPQGKALPNTYMHHVLRLSDLNWVTLYRLQGNDSFLSTRNFDDGRIYLAAVPNDETWSNWPRHALFITSMLRMAEESQRSLVFDHRIGDWSVIEVQSANKSSERPNELKAQDGSVAFIPSQQWINGKLSIGVKDEVKKAGFYDLVNENDLLHTLAFNYSRKESELSFYAQDEIEEWTKDKSGVRVIDSMNSRIKKSNIRDERPLWKLFIIGALLFLLIEIVIIKLLKQKIV